MTDWPDELIERVSVTIGMDRLTFLPLEKAAVIFLESLTPADLDAILAKLRPGAMIVEWKKIEDRSKYYDVEYYDVEQNAHTHYLSGLVSPKEKP